MYYLIDGYNLIFSLIESQDNLQMLRQKVVHSLQKQFANRKASGTLVFDGAHRRDEESGLSYPSPLIVAFAPKGQSADEYIVEAIETAKTPNRSPSLPTTAGLPDMRKPLARRRKGMAPSSNGFTRKREKVLASRKNRSTTSIGCLKFLRSG